MNVREYLLGIAAAIVLVLLMDFPLWAEDNRHVLVINSYHQGYVWSDDELSGLTGRLRDVYPEIEISIEYLDFRRRTDAESRKRIKDFLIEKYRSEKIDLVVILDDPALEMLLQHTKELFPGVPVVFAGIGDFKKSMIVSRANMTGVVETLDIKGTLETALKLHPKAKEVLIVDDDTISGVSLRGKAESLIPLFSDRVSLRFNTPGSFQHVREEIDALPDNAIVLIVSYSTDIKGRTLSHEKSSIIFSVGSAKPIYAVHEGRLGHGIVGGHLLSGKEHGRKAAEICIRVLAGESTSAIPVDYSETSKPMFDYVQLERFGIDEDKLPAGSVVINKPVSVFETHRDFAVGILLLVVVLSALVAMLSISVVRRRRAEEALLLTQLCVDKSPIAICRISEDGKIEAVNDTMCSNLGYTHKELCSMTVFDFDPLFTIDEFRQHRQKVRATGSRTIETLHKRKDGTVFPVEVTVNQLNYRGKDFSYSFTKDITQRKRAEVALRESERRLADIIDFLPDATFAIDQEGRVIAWNRAIEDMTGVKAEDILGRGNYEYSVAFYGIRRPTTIDLAFSNDREMEERYIYIKKEGEALVAEAVVNLRGENRILWGKISKLFDVNGNITGAIEILRDITEHKQAELELRESRQRLADIIDFLPDATFAVDREGRVISWNRAIEEMTGIKAEGMLGKGNFEYALPLYGQRRPMLIDMVMASDEEITTRYHSVKRVGVVLTAETTVTLRGEERFLWGKAVPLFDNNGDMTGCIETMRDITEYKHSEQEQTKLRELLFHSQKMETIGLLAGGVAHDFNNLLTPILGYSDIMLIGLPGTDPKRLMIEQIQLCADRAKDLTKRLLAFSRKQMLELEVLGIGDIVREFQPVVKSAIRENVQLNLNIDSKAGLVRVDKRQIEQALLNLVLNAGDAMPDGGLLTIEVGNFEVDEPYMFSHVQIPKGSYVMLSVSDTGFGMDEETQKHIFEPFFTTKELGRGTGLGLATVYGIVKQHSGTVQVYSEKDRGSVFKIILPRVTKEGEKMEMPELKPDEIYRGSETVLVMEDEDTVRTFVCKALTDLGYNVLKAESSGNCIEMALNYGGEIDLLATDVIMPGKNGTELYDLLRQDRPGMRVLYMSGYASNVLGHHGIVEEGVMFLQKPFTIKTLSQKIRQAIDFHSEKSSRK